MEFNVTVIDRVNNSNSKQFFILKYSKPTIEIVKVTNGYLVDDSIVVLPPKAIVTVKVSSIIGLSKVVYAINGSTKEITLNGEKDYTLDIEISV